MRVESILLTLCENRNILPYVQNKSAIEAYEATEKRVWGKVKEKMKKHFENR